ncbi:two-component system CAI-1 autoinducer sensor kinase/phosphatase CqsS [Paraburkholderia eburnea]|uniref:histidine kinase n=1 Tax=Paraburkholderia eburnea TaxID=1189126 RepID=A0A2S4MJB7_9BURK|nr:HAMP domain-containing sensor histidine kinase [Paraburkholderia eburnea]POR54846.1 two-component system CAI-1 autoinducer sensor kinase/phosphatase CqsS [Paraburkholderia eburnea]PRZ24555.1 two-component system CAI-1 autoinducer sensor kinase/phosphatase CqsS [Paraburkholderia eburnea]
MNDSTLMNVSRLTSRARRGWASLKPRMARAFAPALRNLQYVKRRMRPFALVATMGFPLYYYVWKDLFPQPYENLTLRLIGSALFLPILFSERWPESARKFLPWWWYLATLYSLPFFFTFMLFKNNGNEVWVESALIAAFVMVLLLDWLMLVLQFIVGIGLAVLAYALTTDPIHLNGNYLTHLAIFSFAVAIGAVANYDQDRIQIEQDRAMLATAGSVAHELRTPLVAIRVGAAGLMRYLPALLDTYVLAQRHRLPVPKIRVAHLHSMQGVVSRIEQEALHSNAIIDMLLATARFTGASMQNATQCSIVHCVETALARYPFREGDRARVHCNLRPDFEFIGSEMLTVHVLFNLLKNAFRHMGSIEGAQITIRLASGKRANQLIFSDTGAGISPEALPHVFTRFYTSSTISDDVSLGAGIGLAFCRDVMQAMGGAITCSSEQGKYTEFVLTFPAP